MSEKKNKGGRPSKYKAEFDEQARKLCLLGATDDELADFFNVDVRTINRWKHEHEGFCHALAIGKEVADDRVERSLYQVAVGYEQPDVKIFMPAGSDKPVYAEYVKKNGPDAKACQYWLNNRRSSKWSNKQEIDHTSSDESMKPQIIEIVAPKSDV
jgi:hypothetical protein